jgi:mannose-6-phosphate isomerase
VHPSKASAIEEYKKETERGIFLNAPNRNYKDQNHKPELMVALSDFWLLHGFKNKIAVEEIFTRVPQLNFLQPIFKSGGYLAMYEEVMTMPQEKVDAILSPLLQEIIPKYEKEILQKSDEHFWAARAALTFCKNRIYDRGIFSIYLFNLLHLKQGEGIYQPAGLPHAYLEGQNVEVMANSDNVLRAGLTDKHVDVAELMKHVQFEATHPKIIMTANDVEQLFEAPVEEFLLKRYQAESTVSWSTETATILFIYDGKATIISDEKNIAVKRGEAVLVLAGKEVSIQPLSGSLSLFSVTTPVDKN